MKYKQGVKYLSFGVFSFFLFLAICIIIRPAGLVVNSGISYYGNYLNTLLPFMLAFFTNSYLVWRMASMIGTKSKIDVYFKFILKFTAILMIGIALTPHNIFGQTIFNMAHRAFGTTLFGFQIITAITIVIFIYRDWINILLLILSLLSGYAALVYLLQPTGFMIESQIVFQLSIWALFIRYLNHISPHFNDQHLK